jgi:aspartyl-tRNA(Asn)/glutamyl-tRNA(Gln) amidotransferase subunit B
VTHELLGQLTLREIPFADNPVGAAHMGELVDLVQARRLTGTR